MCLNPSHIYVQKSGEYEKIGVPCKTCWQCKSNRINDWVGRSLAEAAYSDWTMTITLTYRDRTDGHEKIIYPPHFQKFIRALRRRGHSVRYLGVGEYGSAKGRAHFHCILFGKGDKPKSVKPKKGPWPDGENFHDDEIWPHGHMFADHSMSEASIRYVVKYLLKNDDDELSRYWLTMSKKPPLGAEFFDAKAGQLADLGVLPTGYHYLPPGIDEGKKRQFFMTGATRKRFLLSVLDKLRHQGSNRLKPFKWATSGGQRVNEFIEPGLYKVQRDRRRELCEQWAVDNLQQLWAEMDRQAEEDDDPKKAYAYFMQKLRDDLEQLIVDEDRRWGTTPPIESHFKS